MKIEEKRKAIALRKQGKSMNEIVGTLGVSKGSVSLWTRDVVLTPEQQNSLSLRGRSVASIERRRVNRLKNEETKRRRVIDFAKKDFNKISKHELKIIGCMLYLGEGGKSKRGMVRLANADPGVIKIMMCFFRKVCEVPEWKFRGHIHAYEHTNVTQAEQYWSQVSEIPVRQFYKTYTKQSAASKHKRDTLPHGTFDIYVCDTKLFLAIMGWIEGIKEIVLGHARD